VVTAAVSEGVITPTASFKGAVYFKEVAELATEVPGLVTEVRFEEGERLEAGAVLVQLDGALLEADLAAARARIAQAEADLQLERLRMERARELLSEEVTTPQEYDNVRFTVKALEQRVAASRAEAARLERELERKTIRAPFDGVVVARRAERGEWLAAGAPLATFAADGLHDVVVNVPETFLPWSKPGDEVPLRVAGRMVSGTLVPSAPRGDTLTRTFPLRVRVEGADWLLEGMSADAELPVGTPVTSLLVPRDAVLQTPNGQEVVVVEAGKALRKTAKVIGFDTTHFGVEANGLAVGARVVVKGHERLADGQPVAAD
jgi:RND family efflux transporter MFP subunit